MACCLQRAKRIAIGPFRAHFEERMLLKFADYPLHQTLSHRRCGGHFLAIFCGEDRDPQSWQWIATRWILIPLTSDELADMECTPTAVLGDRRQALVPKLRAEQWLWLTEGPERGIGQWGPKLSSVRSIAQVDPSGWPQVPTGPLPVRRRSDPQPALTADAAV